MIGTVPGRPRAVKIGIAAAIVMTGLSLAAIPWSPWDIILALVYLAIVLGFLIYKADDADWAKMRIAFQIKAMLEHAEVSIQEATRLSGCKALAKSDPKTTSIKSFITLITDLWAREDLPVNVRGLAENVMRLAQMVHLDADGLRVLLNEEQARGRGPLTRNLTPYGVVLQTLFVHRRDVVSAALGKRQKCRVVIPREIDLPDDVDTASWKHTGVFLK